MNVKTRKSRWSKLRCFIKHTYDNLRTWAIPSVIAFFIGMPNSSIAQVQPNAGAGTRICIIIPHFKDEYWLSVGYGMRREAKLLDAKLLIYESGGYNSLEKQIELLQTCARRQVDAILIGAVSADDPSLISAIDAISENIPILALVNALNANSLTGRIGVDWAEMGAVIGTTLANEHPKGQAPVRAVLVSGPEMSGWGPLVEGGLRQGLSNSSVNIVAVYYADTGLREQLRKVEEALQDYPDLDYLIGSAPAIEGAMALLRRRDPPSGPKLVATYISHSVLRGLRSGQVEAVPFDNPIEQGKIGIRLAVMAAQDQRVPYITGPDIIMIRSNTSKMEEILLSPAGFLPSPE